MRTRRLVIASAALVAIASSAGAGTTWLLATSRPARSSARFVYSSSDPIAGLSKGSGTGASDVSARVFVEVGGSTARFDIPAGGYANAYAYRYGWVANDASRALFVNREAPAAPTG